MAANKQIIFGIENNKVADQEKPQLEQQPVKSESKPQLQKMSKTSDLGVRVSIKQITKSPIPVVLPSTQPNQPVVALGQQIPPAGVLGNPPQAPNFNPATQHPVVINNQPITNNTTFIPEQTHPAILPAPIKNATKLPTMKTKTQMAITKKENTNKLKTKKTKSKKTLKQTQNKTQAQAPQLQKKKTNRVFGI